MISSEEHHTIGVIGRMLGTIEWCLLRSTCILQSMNPEWNGCYIFYVSCLPCLHSCEVCRRRVIVILENAAS